MDGSADDKTGPICRSCRQTIPLEVTRVSDEHGVTCVDCLTFNGRLTENDRKMLRSLRIATT